MRRQTSSYERVMFHYAELGPMYFAFHLKIRGELGAERLRAAFPTLRRLHPLSAVRMEIDADKRQWITTDGVPDYPLIVREAYAGAWTDEIVDDLKNYMNPRTGPALRFRLLRDGNECHLIMVVHHAVIDGVGAAVVLRDLVGILGDPTAETRAPTSETWAPVLPELVGDELRKEIESRGLPDYLRTKTYLDTPILPYVAPVFPSIEFGLQTLELTESETAAFIALAKRYGVTVHALLGALILRLFADEYGPREGYKRVLQCPVNFRTQFKPGSERAVGLFNGLIKLPIDCSPDRPLDAIASEFGASLRKDFDGLGPLQGYYNFMTHYLVGVKDPEALYRSRPAGPDTVDYDFSLSNIGRVDMPESAGDLVIEEMHGPTFSATKGERVIGVLTFRNRLSLTLIYDVRRFDHETGKRIWRRVGERFREIANGGRT